MRLIQQTILPTCADQPKGAADFLRMLADKIEQQKTCQVDVFRIHLTICAQNYTDIDLIEI